MRIISFVLGIVMILGLAACSPGNNAPAPASVDQEEIQELDATDTPEAAPMTAEGFCELYEGTWKTNDGQIVYIGFQTETGEPIFVTGIEDSDVFYGPGSIVDLVVLMENEYSLVVNFPKVDGEGGFTYDDFDVTIRITYSDTESKMLIIRFNDEPKTEFYFDDGTPEAVFDTAEDFRDYIFESGSGEMLIDPNTNDYVQFYDIGGSPRFLYGTLGFNETSGIGEILEMTLEGGYALIITVRFPETLGNGGTLEPAKTEDYRIVIMENIGITVYAPDGNNMGNFYFGVG